MKIQLVYSCGSRVCSCVHARARARTLCCAVLEAQRRRSRSELGPRHRPRGGYNKESQRPSRRCTPLPRSHFQPHRAAAPHSNRRASAPYFKNPSTVPRQVPSKMDKEKECLQALVFRTKIHALLSDPKNAINSVRPVIPLSRPDLAV